MALGDVLTILVWYTECIFRSLWGDSMIQIQLKQFQQNAIDKILEQFENPG